MINDVLFVPLSEVHGAYDWACKILLIPFNGYVAVSLFFILSGCVLVESLRRTQGGLFISCTNFVVRRILRIYPLVIVAVIGIAALFAALHTIWPTIFRTYSAATVAQNSLLLNWNVIGATWTLQAEIIAVFYIIAIFLLSRVIGQIAFLFALVFSVAALWHPSLVFSVETIRLPMMYFCFGMMIPTWFGRGIQTIATHHIWPAALFVALFSRHIFGAYSQWAIVLHGAGAFLFVNTVYYGGAKALSDFLNNPASQTLGRLSFSFYLFCCVGVMLGDSLQKSFPVLKKPLEYGLPLAMFSIAVGLLLAFAGERFIERPSIAAGKWLSQKILFFSSRDAASAEVA